MPSPLRAPSRREGAHRSSRGTTIRCSPQGAVRRAGLPPELTFHSLRHAFASIMVERGVSSTVLANLMGHTTSATTERLYVHLFNRQRTDDHVREAMESAMSL